MRVITLRTITTTLTLAMAVGLSGIAPAQAQQPKTTDTAQDTQKDGTKKGPKIVIVPSPPPPAKTSGAQSPAKNGLGTGAPAIAPPGIKPPVLPPNNPQQNIGRKRIVEGANLSKDAFRALPGDAIIRLPGGKMISKDDLTNQAKAGMPQVPPPQGKTSPRLAELRSQLEQKRQSELKTRNSKVIAEMARLKNQEQAFQSSPQYQALHREATTLHSQYAAASPAEKTKIETRARELQKQLEDMKTRRPK